MNANRLVMAAVAGCTAVMLGAFGAHGLKSLVSDYQLDIWQKGVDYQFYHTAALLFLALVPVAQDSVWLKRATMGFLIGIILFSGSLYLLALKDVLHLSSIKFLGPITPIGGVFFILGWLSLFVFAVQKSKV